MELTRRKADKKYELKKVGWSVDRYDICLYAQGGLCYLCGRSNFEQGINTRLSADHCHLTDTPRALLCKMCNVSLGWLENNGLLLQITKYLERR